MTIIGLVKTPIQENVLQKQLEVKSQQIIDINKRYKKTEIKTKNKINSGGFNYF